MISFNGRLRWGFPESMSPYVTDRVDRDGPSLRQFGIENRRANMRCKPDGGDEG